MLFPEDIYKWLSIIYMLHYMEKNKKFTSIKTDYLQTDWVEVILTSTGYILTDWFENIFDNDRFSSNRSVWSFLDNDRFLQTDWFEVILTGYLQTDWFELIWTMRGFIWKRLVQISWLDSPRFLSQITKKTPISEVSLIPSNKTIK